MNKNIKSILLNDIIYENNDDVSNVFNSFFVNVGKTTTEFADVTAIDYPQYMKGNYPNSFFFQPITTTINIKNVILTLKNKTCDIHSLPV